MAFLNPHWLKEVGATPPDNGFAVYGVPYPNKFGARPPTRMFHHRTMKSAARRLASMCSGKLRVRAEHAAFVMDKAGICYSLNDIRGK